MEWLSRLRHRQLVEVQVPVNAGVRDLIPVFEFIIESVDPSFHTIESIFDCLFHSRSDIATRMIRVARLLAPYQVELFTRILSESRELTCEIRGCYRVARRTVVRVLHYVSKDQCGLSRLVVVP